MENPGICVRGCRKELTTLSKVFSSLAMLLLLLAIGAAIAVIGGMSPKTFFGVPGITLIIGALAAWGLGQWSASASRGSRKND